MPVEREAGRVEDMVMTAKPKPCIVRCELPTGEQWTYGWEDECEGALELCDPPVVFPDRQSARRAVEISKAFAKLMKAQGNPYNEDFIDSPTRIRIVPVVTADVPRRDE